MYLVGAVCVCASLGSPRTLPCYTILPLLTNENQKQKGDLHPLHVRNVFTTEANDQHFKHRMTVLEIKMRTLDLYVCAHTRKGIFT